MHPIYLPPSEYVLISIVAGLIGAIAMYVGMRILNRTGLAQGDMIVAVGSLVTHQRKNAFVTGGLIHAVLGVIFAFLYLLGLTRLGFVNFPSAVICGFLFGSTHGVIVALALVWVAADQHPLAEFKRASAAVGVLHFAGHVVYGIAVGLVIAIWPIS